MFPNAFEIEVTNVIFVPESNGVISACETWSPWAIPIERQLYTFFATGD